MAGCPLLLGSAPGGALCCLFICRCWVGDPAWITLGELQVLEWICTAGKDREDSRAHPMKLGLNIKREHVHLALGQRRLSVALMPMVLSSSLKGIAAVWVVRARLQCPISQEVEGQL